MGQGEPVPVLSEDQHSHDRHHVGVASPGLEGDGHIPSASVNDPLGHNGAKFGHHIFVFVADHLGVERPEIFDLGTSEFGVLDKDHGAGDQGTLPDVIDRVMGHWLNQGHSFLATSPCACDPEGHGGSVPLGENGVK